MKMTLVHLWVSCLFALTWLCLCVAGCWCHGVASWRSFDRRQSVASLLTNATSQVSPLTLNSTTSCIWITAARDWVSGLQTRRASYLSEVRISGRNLWCGEDALDGKTSAWQTNAPSGQLVGRRRAFFNTCTHRTCVFLLIFSADYKVSVAAVRFNLQLVYRAARGRAPAERLHKSIKRHIAQIPSAFLSPSS